MARTPLPRTPTLNPKFSAAVQEFGIALKNSSVITHRGNKGSSREESLRKFFRERLPTAYTVAEGEVVDLMGEVSPQLDLIFYDNSTNFSFHAEQTQILPAEALLASVEVKSRLTGQEIEKSVNAARKLRKLQPFGRPLGGTDIGKKPAQNIARYFHCVFAYETDLAEANWMMNEYARVKSECNSDHLIDVVYVLNRGVFNIPAKIGKLEDEHGGAITNFYFSILNFILRESTRRARTPFERYVTHATKAWTRF